jgi:hypothetical protein
MADNAERILGAVQAALAHAHLEQARVLRERVQHRSRLRDTEAGELAWALIHSHEAAAKALVEQATALLDA